MAAEAGSRYGAGPTPLIYVTRKISQRAISQLEANATVRLWDRSTEIPRETLRSEVAEIDGLLCLLTEEIDDALLDDAPHLRAVSNMAVGVDNIDLQACTERGIPVGHTPGVLTAATADLTFALLMAVARRIPESVDVVRTGRWRTWDPLALHGVSVFGATLGIVGFGRIGRAVARRAAGFGMDVQYYSRHQRPEEADAVGATFVEFDQLLTTSDFVSLHVPLTPDTFHMIGEAELQQMKSDAILVNTSRGDVVDTEALVQALEDNRIRAAGLDVTSPEPIPPDHVLLELDNCVVLPHIGSATREARTEMARMAADNLIAGLAGDRMPNCANPEVYEL